MSFRSRFQYPHTDPSIHLFAEAVARRDLPLRDGAKVLELGCCETDFGKWMHAAGVSLTGVDARPCPEFLGDTFIQADAAQADLFAEAEFDAVILLGALEHFGLGYYGDPVDPQGHPGGGVVILLSTQVRVEHMHILLVQPTTKYPDKKPLRSRTRWLLGITLPYLAGLTPKGHRWRLLTTA